MRGADCVCHFASAFRETGVSDDYFLAVNVTGARNAVDAAAGQGVRRFVFCSTAAIYGSDTGIVDDRHPSIRPTSTRGRDGLVPATMARHRDTHPPAVGGRRAPGLSPRPGRFPLFGPQPPSQDAALSRAACDRGIRPWSRWSAGPPAASRSGARLTALGVVVLTILARYRLLGRIRCGEASCTWSCRGYLALVVYRTMRRSTARAPAELAGCCGRPGEPP